MKNKNWMYLSFLGLFILGLQLVSTFLERRQYKLLTRLWLNHFCIIPFSVILSLALSAAKIYFSHIAMVRYILYGALFLITYFFGVWLLKNLIVWKKEVIDYRYTNDTLQK